MMKTFRVLLLTIISFFFFASSVNAFSAYSNKTQKFDSSLSDQSTTVFTAPEKIYITQISTPAKDISRNPSLWVKTLYYYYITRLYLPDLPYTYLLDENGAIYEGKTGGVSANLQFEALDNAVVIGYLSNSTSLTARAEASLKEMIESISTQWGITTVKAVQFKIIQDEKKFSSIEITDGSSEFSKSLSNSVSEMNLSKVEKLQYITEIQNIEYPKEAIIGSRVKVKVKFKNNNDYPWFTQKEPIYLSTKSGDESKLAINKVWSSFSKPLEVSDKTIKPGESLELEFEIEAKVLVGEVSETFVLQKIGQENFQGSEFEVRLNVVKGNNTLVQVYSPQYGFVNIRTCRWASCEIVDSPKEGSVYILLLEEEGWYKVQYAPGVEGWAMGKYFKKI